MRPMARSTILPLLSTLLAALPSLPAAAGPLAPTRASQVAVLHPTVDTNSSCGSTFYPVNMMRTSSGAFVPFEIPPKQVFVVTSADAWGFADVPNRRYHFELALATTPSIPGGFVLVGGIDSDASGSYAGSVSAPTGVVIPPGALLCARIGGPSEEPTFIRVHGFFAKNK